MTLAEANIRPTIAIITDDPGWHGAQLKQAFASHHLISSYISATEPIINIIGCRTSIELSNFTQPPLAVFVRGLPGGTLEQIIFRLNVLHHLSSVGVVVYNNVRGIERTVDKAMTSLLLKQAGLPTPNTWVCESKQHAEFIYQTECKREKKLLLKPLFGSQGIGICLLDSSTGLTHDEQFAGVYYLQSFIDCKKKPPFDIRVFVINGKAIAAMTRHGKLWLTNRAQGAVCQLLQLDNQLRDLSEAAANVVGIEYAGVDLIPDKNGSLYIIEVNSIPAWQGLQQVTDINIAARLADDMVRRLNVSTTINC